MVAEQLHVVLDLEPALRIALEADAQRIAERDRDMIGGLDGAAIADAVVERAQIDGLDPLVGALRRDRKILECRDAVPLGIEPDAPGHRRYEVGPRLAVVRLSGTVTPGDILGALAGGLVGAAASET